MNCKIEKCDRQAKKRGWCELHYWRWRNNGSPYAANEAPISRFMSRVEFRGACWIWTGRCDEKGYGSFSRNGRAIGAHRWAYEYFYGPVPKGKVLDHYECSTPPCVNPTHVRAVSHRENLLRSDRSLAALNTAKVVCVNGHPLEGENLQWVGEPGKQWRGCRACRKAAGQRAYEKRLAARGGA